MNSRRVRFGIVGVGRITREQFVPALLSTEQAVLEAAASRDRHRAESLNPRRAYDSYSDLLRDPDIDAVYVATHNGLHKELVIEALENGKHVLCEKPLGCSAGECEEMVAAANVTGNHLVEAFMYRHHPQIAKALELLHQGAIGELVTVEATFNIHLMQSDDVRLHAEWGGGSLLDVGCYCVNFARLLLGDSPLDVRAWAKMHRERGVDMALHAVLEYDSGRHAALSCGFDGGLYQGAVLIGTDGALGVSEPFVTWMRRPRLTLQVGDTEQVTEFDPVNTFRLEIDDLCKAVLTGASPRLTKDEGLKNARLMDRLMAAAGLRE